MKKPNSLLAVLFGAAMMLAGCSVTINTPSGQEDQADASAVAESESPESASVAEWMAKLSPHIRAWADMDREWKSADCLTEVNADSIGCRAAVMMIEPVALEVERTLEQVQKENGAYYLGEPPAELAPAFEATVKATRHLRRVLSDRDCSGAEDCWFSNLELQNKWQELGDALALWPST